MPPPPPAKRAFTTRFVALGTCSAANKDKARKWLHAVAVNPIPYMERAALLQEPADTTDSPYMLQVRMRRTLLFFSFK